MDMHQRVLFNSFLNEVNRKMFTGADLLMVIEEVNMRIRLMCWRKIYTLQSMKQTSRVFLLWKNPQWNIFITKVQKMLKLPYSFTNS